MALNLRADVQAPYSPSTASLIHACSQMEAEGLIAVPVFINGVEAHTVVRDQLTSEFEQAGIASGQLERGSLRRDAVKVDALLSTIGFPLVGGPAGAVLQCYRVSFWC